jgi:predicted NAD/FAD-binding protein
VPAEATVREFVDRFGYGEGFLRRHLLPLGSAIWSSPAGTFERFPVRFVVDFLARHDLLELDLGKRVVWRTIVGGSREYVRRLAEPFRDRIRTSCPVRAIERREREVLVRRTDGRAESFDHVVLACHSDQALALLADPSPAERDILGAIPYERNRATLHTDTSVLPRRPRVRGAWNYRIRRGGELSTLTYDMNVLQGLDARERWCVSINEEDSIDRARVVDRVDFEHPVYTTPREQAQARRSEIQGIRRTTYCGAYWGNGFHEDGVVSGLDAARIVSEVAGTGGEQVA